MFGFEIAIAIAVISLVAIGIAAAASTNGPSQSTSYNGGTSSGGDSNCLMLSCLGLGCCAALGALSSNSPPAPYHRRGSFFPNAPAPRRQRTGGSRQRVFSM